jgi:hypothetical protein
VRGTRSYAPGDDGFERCDTARMAASRRARPGLHICGAITEDGTPCQRPLRNQRWCDKHPGGRSAQVLVAQPAPRPSAPHRQAGPQRIAIPVELPRQVPRAKSAVGLVQELATDGWRRTVADRLSTHLGDEIWSDVDRSWRTGHCKRLAKAARALAAAEPRLATFDTLLGRQTIKREVSRSPLAVDMVDRVISAHTQISTVVLALRVTGIILCELHGCITGCQCLKDLADETAPAMLKAKITQICDDYLLHPA